MEVYVDDIVVKSSLAEDHASHLEKVFERVRSHDMWLNPEKCFFGIGGGKFLGLRITNKGIEANPKKFEAITTMRSSTCLKEVQWLNGKLATLSRFLPKLTEKSKSLFKLLKGVEIFYCNDECETMFAYVCKHKEGDLFATCIG